MKKTLLFSMFVMLTCLTSVAQSLSQGFYRVQNMASGRYLYVRDCTGEISTTGADMGAIELWLGQENTITDPGCIMFFESHGGAWDIQSQGTGIYEMVSYYMTLTYFRGAWTVYNSGQYLYDMTKNNTSPRGKIGATTDDKMAGYTGYKMWNVLPVNSATDQYFGFNPTISAGGSYYTTFYADFAFTPTSANTKVWYVSNVDKQYGIAVIKQLSGTVSRSQPVIIQSTSSAPTNNRADLTSAAGNSASSNKLSGVYFSNGDRSFEYHPGDPACVEFNPQTMRMLGKDANGKLAFVNNPTDLVYTEIDPTGNGDWRNAYVIPHNQAYLQVDADCPASLQVMTEAEYEAFMLTQRTYTLTYKVDGQLYKQLTLKAGDAITPEAAPTKTGYTFSGWDNVPTVMPANDVVVNGSFLVNSYTLTYKVDGAVYRTYTVNYGASITPEAAPTKEGHTFSGWDNVPSVMPANDVTVNGSFTVNIHKLVYKVDGQVYRSYTVSFGTAITPLAAPTREGYTFSGWSEIPAVMPDNDVTVTGSFNINTYTLTYVVDGEVYKTYTINYGARITAEPAPIKEGYTFSGWSAIPSTMPARDVTITGTFKVNSYTLTYMVDGDVYKTYTVNYGASITAEPAPTKEGYTFSGWSAIPSTMPAHDVTITGTFKVNSYTLTYMVDGEVYKTYTVNYGTSITAEPAPGKEGYTFSGWSEIPSTMPARDVTVTGTFRVNSYTLTYMVDDEVYKTFTVNYGASITAEPAPSKEGYTFSGWSDVPETMPANNVVVTGSFTVNSYELTYYVDGVVYQSYTLNYGTEITPLEEPTSEGQTFSGWSEIPSTMPSHDVDVYGSFDTNTYILTYKVDGVVFKTFSLEFGTSITPIDEPAREGYTFSGWSEVPETMPAHNVEINGTFTVNSYTLTYMVDGEVYVSVEYQYGENIEAEDYPVREGYTFSGWSGLPAVMPAYDVIVTGSFTINSYKLNYLLDGMLYTSVTLEYGSSIIPIESPVREGYSFSGWSGIPETMPAHDVEAIGSFTVNTYTLTYMVDGEEYLSVEYKYGESIVAEDYPIREGYTFSGWSGLPAVMPAEDVIVSGSFSINHYTITYLYEGEQVHIVTLAYDEEIPEYMYQPESNIDIEYTFVEWLEDGESFTLTHMPARDVVLTASVDAKPTGISNVRQSASSVIFDLQGRRVQSMKRGQMYIINGRKYIHK